MNLVVDQTTAKYLRDERAQRLAASVDEAYWSFTSELPTTLRELAGKKGTFDHRSGDAPILSLSERNAINTGSLFLFWELCRSIDDWNLFQLAEASAYSGLAYILLDHLVDNQTSDPSSVTLLQQSFHEQAIRNYQLLFPPAHPFWPEFDRLSSRLRSSLALESDCRRNPAQHSEESFIASTQGKVSPAVLTVAAATMLAPDLKEGDRSVIRSALEYALLELICAGQLAHDIEEWRKDLAQGDLTFFLSTCGTAEEWQRSPWPSQEVIEDRLFETRKETHYCQKAAQWFERAKENGETIEVDSGTVFSFANWNEYIDRYVTQGRRFADEAARRVVKRALFGIMS